MSSAWAFVPSAPLLLMPDEPALHEVRAAALAAVRAVLRHAETVLILAEHPTPVDDDESAGGDLQGLGLAVRAGGDRRVLGLGHTVGAWLLDRCGWRGPRQYVTVLPPHLRAAVTVVVADGPACLSASSPRPFDPRGVQLQETVIAALRGGDAQRLAALSRWQEVGLQWSGGEVLAAAGQAAAGQAAAGQTWRPDLRFAGAPLGVGYWVATWQ